MLKVNPLYGYEEEIQRMMREKIAPNKIVEIMSHVASKATIIRYLKEQNYVRRSLYANSNLFLEDHYDELLELVEAGKSARAISLHFGGAVSRNAVIGFCNRRGIRLRNGPTPPQKKKSTKVWHTFAPKLKTRNVDPFVKNIEYIPPIPEDGGKTLEQLTSKDCHHPLWRAEEPIGKYCGRPVLPGTQYCPTCYNHVYEPVL